MSSTVEEPLRGKLTGSTRRDFIAGIASAGASTAAAVALDRAGGADLFSEEAFAGGPAQRVLEVQGASRRLAADAFEVPRGLPRRRADRLRRRLQDGDRRRLRYGYNNDFLAYFPLRGSREGLLFVNHEYPDPFFLHGYKPDGSSKSAEQVQQEQDAVGNSILHIKRRKNGTWKVVSPSDYNRRIYGDRPKLRFTGPLRGAPGIGDVPPTARSATARAASRPGAPRCRARRTSTATAPTWRRASTFGYGWHQHGGQPEDAEYEFKIVQEVRLGLRARPLRPRLRRAQAHRPRALPPREHRLPPRAGQQVRALHGRRQGQRGRLQVRLGRARSAGATASTTARSSRRASSTSRAGSQRGGGDSPRPATSTRSRPTEGTGRGRRCREDGAGRHRHQAAGATSAPIEYDLHFATNRPEDVEVARRRHGLHRADQQQLGEGLARVGAAPAREGQRPRGDGVPLARLRRGRPDRARGGCEASRARTTWFSTRRGNLWVVTDISLGRLNGANEYTYHANNAIFMVPTSGLEQGRGVPLRQRAGARASCTGPTSRPTRRRSS